MVPVLVACAPMLYLLYRQGDSGLPFLPREFFYWNSTLLLSESDPNSQPPNAAPLVFRPAGESAAAWSAPWVPFCLVLPKPRHTSVNLRTLLLMNLHRSKSVAALAVTLMASYINRSFFSPSFPGSFTIFQSRVSRVPMEEDVSFRLQILSCLCTLFPISDPPPSLQPITLEIPP